MKRKFKVLYTHQKMKKRKIWQDGSLSIAADGNRAFLSDETNRQISTVYLNKKKVENGTDLESDKYLIQVEEEEESSTQSQENNSAKVAAPAIQKVHKVAVKAKVAVFGLSKTKKSGGGFVVPRRLTPSPSPSPPEVSPPSAHTPVPAAAASSIWSSVMSESDDDDDVSHNIPNISRSSPPDEDVSRQHAPIHGRDEQPTYQPTHQQHRDEVSYQPTVQHRDASDLLKLLGCTPDDAGDMNNTPQAPSRGDEEMPATNDQVSNYEDTSASNEDLFANCGQFSLTSVVEEEDKSQQQQAETSSGVYLRARSTKRSIPTTNLLQQKTPTTNYNQQQQDDQQKLLIQQQKEDRQKLLVQRQKEKEDKLNKLICSEIIFPSFRECRDLQMIEFPVVSPPNAFASVEEYLQYWKRFRTKEMNMEMLEISACYFTKMEGTDLDGCAQLNYTHSIEKRKTERTKINNMRSLTSYLNRGKTAVNLFVKCQLIRREEACEDVPTNTQTPDRIPPQQQQNNHRLMLKFSREDRSLLKSKGMFVAVSKSLNFVKDETFVAKLVSNLDQTSSEMIIEPLTPLSPLVSNNSQDSMEFVEVILLTKSFTDDCFQLVSKCPSCFIRPFICDDQQVNKEVTSSWFDPQLVTETLTTLREVHGLNEEQENFFRHLTPMLSNGTSPQPSIVIDGMVGTGKTRLLALAVKAITDMMTSQTRKLKILIISKHASSVDRFVQQLVDMDMKQVVRLGDLNEIDHFLLPYSFHPEGGVHQNTKILKDMLRRYGERQHPAKRSIERSLEQLSSGKTRRNLHDAVVVATTSGNLLSSHLRSYKFQLLIVDDCDSMSELVTMATVARFRLSNLILAGDSYKTRGKNMASLFQRLANGGCKKVELRRQYRFNNRISALLNQTAFYDGKLSDGKDGLGGKLLAGLPHVCMYELAGKELELSEGNFVNQLEADFVCDVIKLFLARGIPGTSLLVVTATTAQVRLVEEELQNINQFYDMGDIGCIEVTTFDDVIARHKPVVICSFVRTSAHSTQLKDKRLIMSMMSRASSHVIMIGNRLQMCSTTLMRLIRDYCQANKHLYSSFDFRKLSKKLVTKVGPSLVEEEEVPMLAFPSQQQQETTTQQETTIENDENEIIKPKKKNRKFVVDDDDEGDFKLLNDEDFEDD